MSELLVEIGTEELPPMAVGPALEQLADATRKAFESARLDVGAVRTTGTLRRLVLIAEDLAAKQRDRATLVRGPAARVAFDADGRPTQAAAGFARAQGVPVDALQVKEMESGRYAVAEIREAGRRAAGVVRELLPEVIAGLSFPKTMRWMANGMRFGRPIRRIVVLLDRRVLAIEIAGIRAGRTTRGHRFLAPRTISLPTAGSYGAAMRRARVILSPDDRRRRVVELAESAADRAGGRPILDPALLEEIVWSTEHPTPLLGTIDPALASAIPRPVLIVTLQHHQKSFAVEGHDGTLLPAFIAVRDGGTDHLKSVRTGHEWVVRARLADARFFLEADLEEDRRTGFASRNEALTRVGYVAGLGTVADHVRRLTTTAAWLAQATGASAEEQQTLVRAAELCKADLVTAMVREFPELQGTMGGIYARMSGAPDAVARAIEEHYMPRSAGEAAAPTRPGAFLAIADRAVLLTGALLEGFEPTGSQDPFGLRRAASGIVATLLAHTMHVSLRALFGTAASTYDRPADARERAVTASVEFVLQRLRTWLIDHGVTYDTVDAVLAAAADDVADLEARARALQAVRSKPEMARLATGFARASRILSQGAPASAVDESLLIEPAEATLYREWQGIRDMVDRACAGRRYGDALDALTRLAGPIDTFFDDVLVMAPDARIRANRLALLRGVSETFLHVADFAKLAGVKP
ncbi:MAG: glycine--tRNA ligase subunit beta [Armatimonadota bacterium]